MLRQPAVAGAFYPAEKSSLVSMLERFLSAEETIEGVVGAVSPHAGYPYSGAVAGALFACVDVPETVVVLGPNHRGLGAAYGIWDKGAWQTPLGEVAIDEDFAAAVKRAAPFVKSDHAAHAHEHSIEVQVPFIQYRRSDVRLVPICIGAHDYDRLVELGEAIARASGQTGRKVLVVASSDMSHYEPASEAKRKDTVAIERMVAMDEEGLWEVVRRHDISMCGVAPAVATIAASKGLGADQARLVMYTNSGETTGDYDQVVGYASLAFFKGNE